MATMKQKIAFGKLLENHGNVYQAMAFAGYSLNTAKNAKELTSSRGFKELAAEIGLTESFLTTALVDDIRAKPTKRHKELELGFKVLGIGHDKAEPPSADTYNFIQNNINPNAPESRKIIEATTKVVEDMTRLEPADPGTTQS